MMTTLQSLRAQKTALRKVINARLNVLSASCIAEQSREVAARIQALPAFLRCNAVSCYLSMPSGELDTSVIVSEVLNSGKSLYVPKIQSKDSHMDLLKVYGHHDLFTLPSGLWGIKEPSLQFEGDVRSSALDSASESIDIIFLPGVAFDRSFSRLGHGKGYYDRFLTTYMASGHRRPFLVGLALREQVLGSAEIPMGEYDWKMDMLISPDETISAHTTNI